MKIMTGSITEKICEEHDEEDLRRAWRRRSTESMAEIMAEKICGEHDGEDLRRA